MTHVIRHNRGRNWHNLGSVRELTTPLSNAVRSSVIAAPVLLGAGDPGSTRLVYAMVAGLVVIGVLFVLLGIWLFRQTRYDPPVLAPLERMGDKEWRRQRDPATQRRVLDEVRPTGAEPLRHEPSPPNLDAEFESGRSPRHLDERSRTLDAVAPISRGATSFLRHRSRRHQHRKDIERLEGLLDAHRWIPPDGDEGSPDDVEGSPDGVA